MVAPFLRHPPADGAGPTMLPPVQPGAGGGGAGEPLDGGQLACQALAVEAGAGGGGFRHGRSVVPEVKIANNSITLLGGVSWQRKNDPPKALVVE